MKNLLLDPRAIDLMSASTTDISALGQYFRSASREASYTAHGLRLASRDANWTGHAADTFRASIGHLPRRLDYANTGVAEVSDALLRYEAVVWDLQAKFGVKMSTLAQKQGDLTTAGTSAQQAGAAFRKAAHTSGTSTRDLIALELAAGKADGTVGDLQGDIRRLVSDGEHILEEFAAARSACVAAIESATSMAPVETLWTTSQRGVSDPAVPTVPRHGSRHPSGGAGLGPVHGGRSAQHGGRATAGRRRRVPGTVSTGPGAAPHGGLGPTPGERQRIDAMQREAQSLLGTSYVSGGGHGGWGTKATGVDCSGFVSAVLHAGGYLNAPQTTEGFAGQPGMVPGHGHWVTIYDRTACGANEHVIINLNGTFYESGGGPASGGAPYVHRFTPSPSYLASFNTILHPAGL